MEERKNEDKPKEKLIYSPRRRKNSKKNAKMVSFLEGLGRRHDSDKNALKFVANELKRKVSIVKYKDSETFFNSNYYLMAQLVIVSYILIEEEIKNIFTDKSADLPFSIIILLFMVLNIIELIIYSRLIKDYFLNFYFWLDIISIISILLDIHWFNDFIIERVGNGKIETIDDLMKRNESNVSLAIKIIKVIRIIRIVRTTKLFIIIEKIVYKIKRKKDEKERIKYEEEEKRKKLEENESKKKVRIFMEEYIKNALSNNNIPKKNSANFIVNIMKKALKKCKENNMTPSSPKKILNVIRKNLGISLNEDENKKNKNKEGNKEDQSDKSDDSKEYSLIENKQMIEINIGDNKEELISFPNKEVPMDNMHQNNFSLLKKTFLSSDINENKSIPQIKLQINKNNDSNEETKLSEILLKKCKQKVILLILIEFIVFNIFNPSNYINKKTSFELGLKLFNSFQSDRDEDFSFYYNLYIDKHKDIKTPLIFLKVGDLIYGNLEDVKNLREQEKLSYSEKCSNFNVGINNNSICIAIFNYKYINRLYAILNLIKTILAIIILYFGNFWFSRDLSKMILDPTDLMVERVKLISENPLQIIQDEEKKRIAQVIEEEKERENQRNNEETKTNFFCNSSKNNQSNKVNNLLETELLEKTISKIGALLALSLGDAGAEIISQNMKENSSGDVNPMIPGKKVCAIYGFCDIRNFTGLTEILQEKVMVFVNNIADIVHQCAFEYGGSANKNIGDAFLLVWKFDNKFTYISKKNNELKVYNCEQVNQICDMALISILKIFAGIKKSKEIKKFKNLEEIIRRFGKDSIKIGFGIHQGWSIEGAIGASFKIDASYLSPNYNMANICEEKTKVYGVDLVMTDKFVENLSNEAQKNTRILDICYDDEDGPIGFYTMDFETEDISDEEELDIESDNAERNKKASAMKRIKRFKKRFERRQNLEMATSIPPKKYFWNEFEQGDKDWEKMRMNFRDEFFKYYNRGFDEFHFGDWSHAKELLEKTLKYKEDDNPTKRMLEIMKKYNYIKPENFRKNL